MLYGLSLLFSTTEHKHNAQLSEICTLGVSSLADTKNGGISHCKKGVVA